MIATLVLLACTPPEGGRRDAHGPGDSGDTSAPTDTTPPVDTSIDTAGGPTGDTGGTTVPFDCTQPLAVLPYVTWSSSPEIVTEEDFDFDGNGNLVMQRSSDLQGVDRYGNVVPIAAGAGSDCTGIRAVSTGDITIAEPGLGSVRRIDINTGGSVSVLGGLQSPNGLEASEDGFVYVTENVPNGDVRKVDPYTGDFEIVFQADYPNGVVLSHDEETLYVATGGWGTGTRIAAISKDANGEWDPSTLTEILDHPEFVGSLTVDICSNVYGLEYNTGRVFRVRHSDGVLEQIVDIPDFGSFSALHFSPGLGAWDPDALYVTSRMQLYQVNVGIPGSHVLAP